jgi:hypothetical protein
MNHPSRLTFWRIVLFASAILLYMAAWDFLRLAQELGVTVPASRSWMGLLSLLVIGGLAALLTLTLTGSRTRERVLSLLELPARIHAVGFFFPPRRSYWLHHRFLRSVQP